MKNILEFSHTEAKRYFLKEESYFNFDLPRYFVFQELIHKLSEKLEGKLLSDFYGSSVNSISGKQKPTPPCDYENVNYKFLNNKDGKFAWRPFQLIHPAIYVSLVHQISEEKNWDLIVKRFKEFSGNPKIKCFSFPLESEDKSSDKAETVSNWWKTIEQQSIELALEYEYVLHIDISDCYGSIYSHSIAWALHSRETGKKERKNTKLIGNIIDTHLRDMSYGQTNGIPQGSVLMDFIAEMVLGFADLELSRKIENLPLTNYQIIRYRDDYRIFTNNPQDAALIVKNLTEILTELGMRLNSQKTLASSDVVENSIKPDKLYWLINKKRGKNLQENLLLIHHLSKNFPNSGSLNKALSRFFGRVERIKKTNENLPVLISILVDIAYKNPRTYPIAAAILSKFLALIDSTEEQNKMLNLIEKRFAKIPNTGYLQIWLQRMVLKIDPKRVFNETLCNRMNDPNISIWNSDWANKSLRKVIDDNKIVNEEIMKELNKTIAPEEVQLFESKTHYTY